MEMNRRFVSTGLIAGLIACSGCTTPPSVSDTARSKFERIERRLQRLERDQGVTTSPQAPNDPKAPAGPIRSLTLRIGTDDDRLRLYWADGQTSDLICSKEGKGTWACG